MESILHAEFFEYPLRISAPGLAGLLRFQLGPHLATDTDAENPLQITVTALPSDRPERRRALTGLAGLPVEIQARDASGAPLLRRTWNGWGNLPPVIPPFAVWRDHFAVAPAVVLAKDGVTLALLASPDTRHTLPAVALASRGWQFVSGSLLVLDRRNGEARPCHLPIQASATVASALGAGAGLSAVATGSPDQAWRRHSSVLGYEVFLARPEAFGTLVPVRSRCAPPTLIRVCPDAGENVRLEPDVFRPPAWPSEASSALADLPLFRLTLPEAGSLEAARLIDRRFTPRLVRATPMEA